MQTKILALLTTLLLFSAISADVRFVPNRSKAILQPQNTHTDSFLPDFHRTDTLHNRRMQETNSTKQPVTIRLRGDTNLGYYYATLFFGSPIQKQTLIVDTGSMTTTIPCQECGDNCGHHHFDKPFYHNLSSTFELFQCQESFGAYTCGDCLNQCPFGVSYVEGSSYNGHFVRDFISFGNEIEDHYDNLKLTYENEATLKGIDLDRDTSGNSTESSDSTNLTSTTQELVDQLGEIEDIINQRKIFMPFGCTFRETKLFYEQEADGILGLGINTNTQSTPPNILDALNLHNTSSSKAFTLCLSQDGGYFTLGGYNHAYHANETIQYANYYTEYGQYRVVLNNIEIDGQSVNLTTDVLNKGEGAFFDSGTTLTYAPSETYDAITGLLKTYCKNDATHCGKGISPDSKLCWKYSKADFPDLNQYLSTFPTIKFYFGDDGKAEYEWRPEDYLYEKSTGKYCMGLSRYNRETILGATFMKNHDILFDKQNNKVGMVRSNCAAVNNVSEPIYSPHANAEVNAIQIVSELPHHEQIQATEPHAPKNDDFWKIILVGIFVVLGISCVVGLSIYLYLKLKKRSSYADMGPEVELPRREVGSSSDVSGEHHEEEQHQQQQVVLPVLDFPVLDFAVPGTLPKIVMSVTSE